MAQADWLRDMPDAELVVVAREIEARGADAKTRQLVNDELRRRKMPTLTTVRWD